MVSLTDIYFLHRVSPGCGGCQNRSSTGVVYPGTRTLPEENSCIRPQWTLSRTGSDSCQCRSHCSFGPDDPQSRKTQGGALWESILAAADIHFYVFFLLNLINLISDLKLFIHVFATEFVEKYVKNTSSTFNGHINM